MEHAADQPGDRRPHWLSGDFANDSPGEPSVYDLSKS
jgi:hypothetical protein